MIRYSLLFVGLLAVAEGVQAQSKAEGMFDELSRDFGSVPRGPTLVHPFRIVNKTNATIQIARTNPSFATIQGHAPSSTP